MAFFLLHYNIIRFAEYAAEHGLENVISVAPEICGTTLETLLKMQGRERILVSRNIDSWKASFYHFSLETLALLPLVKKVTPSPDRKTIKLLTFDNLFRYIDILAKTRSRMTKATTFSRQNDVGSRANTS